MTATTPDALRELVSGFDHIETRRDLEARVALGRPLRVKLGLDPTTADLHIGHAVVLRKLQQFVERGDRVTLVIGDFTTRIGDPSGRNELRPALSTEQIEANMRTYAEQAGRVLDMERIELRYNSEWLAPLNFADLIRLASRVTVAQMLEREDFKKRYTGGVSIALHEFLYPLAQAYDSVALESDIELGGNDQLFNLLMGRHYQSELGQPPQICMTVPLLEGIDGIKKMSKSTGNAIALTEPANDQFGKLMRIPDELIARYARLAAGFPAAECDALERELTEGSRVPMDEKKRVAAAIVTAYHGAEAARVAREYFERTVQRKEAPDSMPSMAQGAARKVSEVLVAAGFAESKRAAERLIAGGGVRVDGVTISDPAAPWSATATAVVAVGSRRFMRVTPNEHPPSEHLQTERT
jgi:tyrosyl-tRNA synthetase